MIDISLELKGITVLDLDILCKSSQGLGIAWNFCSFKVEIIRYAWDLKVVVFILEIFVFEIISCVYK